VKKWYVLRSQSEAGGGGTGRQQRFERFGKDFGKAATPGDERAILQR
jgi:hypothetical protein